MYPNAEINNNKITPNNTLLPTKCDGQKLRYFSGSSQLHNLSQAPTFSIDYEAKLMQVETLYIIHNQAY